MKGGALTDFFILYRLGRRTILFPMTDFFLLYRLGMRRTMFLMTGFFLLYRFGRRTTLILMTGFFLFYRFGRRTTLILMTAFATIWWFITTYAPNYNVFLAARVFVALGRISAYVSGFVLCKYSAMFHCSLTNIYYIIKVITIQILMISAFSIYQCYDIQL